MKRKPISHQEVLAGRDAPGGWTRQKLAEWGVPWPPPGFWMQHLVAHGVPYLIVDDGSDDYKTSPYMSESTRRTLENHACQMKRSALAPKKS